MSGDAARRALRLVPAVDAANGSDPASELATACVSVLGVSGVSLMVMNEGTPSLLSASDPVATRLEDLQLVLGEGPGIDAHLTGRGVGEPDLARPRYERWLAFTPAACAAGAGAVFCFPLRIGAVRLGVLTAYTTAPGGLSDEQYVDAIAVAGLAATAILAIQAESSAGLLDPHLEMLASNNASVHQASGMVSVQLGVGVGEALTRIRASAFAQERPLPAVAADIVARRLSFAP